MHKNNMPVNSPKDFKNDHSNTTHQIEVKENFQKSEKK
jgi:hypothetical protein